MISRTRIGIQTGTPSHGADAAAATAHASADALVCQGLDRSAAVAFGVAAAFAFGARVGQVYTALFLE